MPQTPRAARPVPAIDRDTVMCISLAARRGNHGNRFHNFLYGELGLNFVYKSFSARDIGAAVAGIRSLDIRGAGVSMPYKESCMPFLDRIDDSAAVIDSVNTIVNDDGILTGYNTDYLAVRELLARVDPGTSFAVLGCGGMAKAVVAALHDLGFGTGTVIANTSLPRAQALAQRYGYQAGIGLAGPTGLLVNATPVGMSGGPEEHALAFTTEQVAAADAVLDVVALPPSTPLVRASRRAGKLTLTGDEVMMRQALEQFVMYTGVRPDADQLARAEQYASQ